jgi:acyl carrier protein
MFTKEEFTQAVVAGIKQVMSVDEVTIGDDEDFSDFGLDSLQGMNLVLEVEGTLDIDLGEFDLTEANTMSLFYQKACEIVA